MQTFLPYPDLQASCVVLDDRRLGKQRVETFQILRALTWPSYAWKNHPAVTMWRGFVPALVAYGLASCAEWTRRGYADRVAGQLLAWGDGSYDDLPPWFGLEALHRSHRSSLVRKDPGYYRPLFPDVPDDLPYHWPAPAFPRWPVRAERDPVGLPEALRLLGLADPRPGQADAVAAIGDGRDVLLAVRPGAGGTTTGLLAGLRTPGRTLWVAPPGGELAGPIPDLDPPASRRVVAARTEVAAVARPPGPEDQLAMRNEHRPSDWTFTWPGEAVSGSYGLVVLDGAREVPQWQRPVDAPVLAVVGRVAPGERERLAAQLDLADPVVVGGGWDVPSTRLRGVVVTAAGRRTAVAGALRTDGPGLVVVSSRERATALAGRLAIDGLRAAAWAPTMRPAAATAAIGAWRSRGLDALVVPAGELPPLGRRRLPLLVHADAPGDVDAWRDVVEELTPEVAVLLAGPEAVEQVRKLAAAVDVRAALVASYVSPDRPPVSS